MLSLGAILSFGLLLTLLFAFMTLWDINLPVQENEIKYVRRNLVPHHFTNQIHLDHDNITYMECDDGENKLAVFGDGYCDCKDGSDEVLTDACSFFLPHVKLFHCNDNSDRSIFSSRVNDFVCDCPNGLDEYDTLVFCPDKDLAKPLQ